METIRPIYQPDGTVLLHLTLPQFTEIQRAIDQIQRKREYNKASYAKNNGTVKKGPNKSLYLSIVPPQVQIPPSPVATQQPPVTPPPPSPVIPSPPSPVIPSPVIEIIFPDGNTVRGTESQLLACGIKIAR